MYGQMMLPMLPGGGAEKQDGLKNWFAFRLLRGSHVKTTLGVIPLVPNESGPCRLVGSPTLRLPFVLGCIGAPLWNCVMPESTQPFTTPPRNLLSLMGLGRLNT